MMDPAEKRSILQRIVELFREKRDLLNHMFSMPHADKKRISERIIEGMSIVAPYADEDAELERLRAWFVKQEAAMEAIEAMITKPTWKQIDALLAPARKEAAFLFERRLLSPVETAIIPKEHLHGQEDERIITRFMNRAGMLAASTWTRLSASEGIFRERGVRARALAGWMPGGEPQTIRMQMLRQAANAVCANIGQDETGALAALIITFTYGADARGRPASTSVAYLDTYDEIIGMHALLTKHAAWVMVLVMSALGKCLDKDQQDILLDYLGKIRFAIR